MRAAVLQRTVDGSVITTPGGTMNIIVTILVALPIGLLVRNRGTALLSYLIADLFVFTFQTLDVLLNWMAGKGGLGDAQAFGPNPGAFPISYSESDVFAYGVVNLAITLAGTGLVLLGHRIRARRAAAKNVVTVG
jgi:hypothetical protein